MKKTTLVILLFSTLSTLSIFQSCKNDEDPLIEFIADDNTFANYATWHLHTTKQGIDPANGGLHDGNDSTVVRKVYIKDDQSLVNGQYPVGTLIVKHSSNGSSFEQITAMVKRGNGFSPDTNDWEWFMLAPDGKIAKDPNGNLMRGAKLMNGMCNSCHNAAASKDFVFSK